MFKKRIIAALSVYCFKKANIEQLPGIYDISTSNDQWIR